MSLRRRLACAAALPALLLLFLLLTFLFIPDREVEGVFVRLLAGEGYTLKAARFGKSLPLGITARDLHIESSRGELLRFDRFSAGLRLLPLLSGRVVLGCDATVGSGRIAGAFALSGGRMELEINGLRLEDIPFFRTVAEARVQGILQAHASFRGEGAKTSGQLQLQVRGAEIGGVKISEMPLPDATYKTVQGMLRATAGRLNLESFTLDGDGIYARLKGDMPVVAPLAGAPLNLVLEIMPQAELMERQKFVFLLLVKYQTSPGHYEIPIRGVLGKPAIF